MTTERIDINPEVMMGKPVIRGTRITVELILRRLAEGATESSIREEYPFLAVDDIRAAVAYGAASMPMKKLCSSQTLQLPRNPENAFSGGRK